jgi:hypothetical protein
VTKGNRLANLILIQITRRASGKRGHSLRSLSQRSSPLGESVIINIRGTSGSGKSTLMRTFIDRFKLEPADGTPTINQYFDNNANRRRIKEYGYWSKTAVPRIDKVRSKSMGLAIVGDYENDCGGCDGVTTKGAAQDEIQDRIDYFDRTNRHVLFEGLLISHIYGRYKEMALEKPPGHFVFAGMDTPLELCKQQINERRAKSGKPPLVDHRNTIMMYEDVLKVEQKCKADNLTFIWIDHTRAFEHVCAILNVRPYE